MKTFVADACALIAYLFDETGADIFENMLIKARQNEIVLVMHAVNLGEVYYDVLKRNDYETAQLIYQEIRQLPIRFEHHISDGVIFRAGELKKSFRIYYADAFAAAQSFISAAELITTDHKEFEPLEKAMVVRIFWLR